MSFLRGIGGRVKGALNLPLQDQIASDIDVRIRDMLNRAVLLWEAAAWSTYDHTEVNCTVQLYRWCKEASRSDRHLSILSLQLEWLNLSDAILEGRESVKTASRPDLRVQIGETGRTIECKRLAPRGPFTRLYVMEGLARFVLGKYGQDEASGYMVGYVQDGVPLGLIKDINSHIRRHADMGEAHVVGDLTMKPPSTWGLSRHTRAGKNLVVDHLLVDMRANQKPGDKEDYAISASPFVSSKEDAHEDDVDDR